MSLSRNAFFVASHTGFLPACSDTRKSSRRFEPELRPAGLKNSTQLSDGRTIWAYEPKAAQISSLTSVCLDQPGKFNNIEVKLPWLWPVNLSWDVNICDPWPVSPRLPSCFSTKPFKKIKTNESGETTSVLVWILSNLKLYHKVINSWKSEQSSEREVQSSPDTGCVSFFRRTTCICCSK